jgi:hypothetical protein
VGVKSGLDKDRTEAGKWEMIAISGTKNMSILPCKMEIRVKPEETPQNVPYPHTCHPTPGLWFSKLITTSLSFSTVVTSGWACDPLQPMTSGFWERSLFLK